MNITSSQLKILLQKLKKREKGLFQLLLLGLASASILAFIEIAEDVAERDSHAVDEKILLFFRSKDNTADPIGPDWFEEAARDFTALGSYSVITFVTLLTVGLLLILKRKKAAAFAFGAVLSGVLLTHFLKWGFDRPRPDLVSHHAKVMTSSFPSGHSMLSVIVYLSLAVIASKTLNSNKAQVYLISAALLASILIGMTRIYLGVHWPTDVLSGLVMGIGWALICWIFALRIESSYN